MARTARSRVSRMEHVEGAMPTRSASVLFGRRALSASSRIKAWSVASSFASGTADRALFGAGGPGTFMCEGKVLREPAVTVPSLQQAVG